MTQEREIEIEGRLARLETAVEQLTKLVTEGASFWRQFMGSTTGGIIVGLAIWWVNKH